MKQLSKNRTSVLVELLMSDQKNQYGHGHHDLHNLA